MSLARKPSAGSPHPASAGATLHYERHHPEQTTLYRLVPQQAARFSAHNEASTKYLLQFIMDGVDAFLACGILA